jgi:hypothetical protein
MDLNNEILNAIHEKFPMLQISIFPDETQDNIIVAINDDLYYSEEYLALVMDIKINLLWKNNIFNYLFVKEEYKDSFIPIDFVFTIPSAPLLNFYFDMTKTINIQPVHSTYSDSDGEHIWPMAA